MQENLESNWREKKEIVFPEQLTVVDTELFKGYSNLEKITLSNQTTVINNFAFDNCVNLYNINMSDSIESIGNSAFSECKKLEIHTLPKKLKSIGANAFRNCLSLNALYLQEDIEKIGSNAFSGCRNLKNIYIPALHTYFEENIFSECEYVVIHCAFGSSAMEYAIRSEIPFELDVILIDNDKLIPTYSSNDISGSGWSWNAKKKELSLLNYEGGSILSGVSFSIRLESQSQNYISPGHSDDSKCGILCLDGMLTLSGDGALTIEKYDCGINVDKILRIESGVITAVGNECGLCLFSGVLEIFGGTFSAMSLNETVNKPGIIGKIRPTSARMFVGDNHDLPKLTQTYLNQKYVCITHDLSYNPDQIRVIKQVIYNIGENSQVITGDNYGTVIGNDAIVNRSTIASSNAENEKTDKALYIGEGVIINHSSIESDNKK